MSGFDNTTQSSLTGRALAGRYRMVTLIARGGMAEVWEGYDEVLSRPIAIKVLRADLTADEVFLERFRREAITAARLAHPGIVATFDTGVDQGTAFIVMELVRGQNLRQLLDQEGRIAPWRATSIAAQMADALAHSHHAGLVHRDVKPANVLIVDDDSPYPRVKVTDFGIAKAGMYAGADLTRTGMVLGTPKYLSPEQIRGGDPDARADLYSLGVVLYEMLVGAPPFVGDNDMATALAHLSERVPHPSASVRGIPADLDRLVVDLLAKAPAKRPQTASEVRDRLDELVPSRPVPSLVWAGDLTPTRLLGRRRNHEVGDRTREGSSDGWSGAPGDRSGDGQVRDGSGRGRGGPGRASQGGGSGPRRGADDPRRHLRSERAAGLVVLALVVIGIVVAASLLSNDGSSKTRSDPDSKVTPIEGVTVYMVDDRPPDNPGDTHLAFDGNPATFWATDQYRTPTFSGLYPGIGLAIQLRSSATLRTLAVTSATKGWSAQAYVSDTPVASGQSVTAWGQPTGTQTDISGNVTLSLGGRKGRYVLLWITNLGPADQAEVAELQVSAAG